MTYTSAIVILHIKHGASKDEVKKAFFKLAHIHHPDKGGEAKKFVEIKDAYEYLMENDAPKGGGGFTRNSTYGFGYSDKWWNPITQEWEQTPPTTAKTTTRSKAETYESSWADNLARKMVMQQEILNKKKKILQMKLDIKQEEFQLAMLEMQMRDL